MNTFSYAKLSLYMGKNVLEIKVLKESSLTEILAQEGIFFARPCGGAHTCGKCMVWAKGQVCPPVPEEKAICQGQKKHGASPRLACCLKILGNAQVWLPVQEEDKPPAVAALEDGLHMHLKDENCPLVLAADIGTTTISAVLFMGGKVLAQSHQISKQRSFGADVLSRIEYSNQNGTDGLQKIVVKQLQEMFLQMAKAAKVKLQDINTVAITGNTSMLHYLQGLEPRGIGTAPFTPQSLFGIKVLAGDIFEGFGEKTGLILPPGISAYVGPDIVCGMLFAGLVNNNKTQILLDVGTSGEMVLVCGDKIYCCSAAAGPAFEGAEIERGMSAVEGAIHSISLVKGGLKCHVMGGGKAKGICGTGIISALCFMLKNGVLSGSGALQANGPFAGHLRQINGQMAFVLQDGIALTQRDVRNVQLAKAAIAAGIETMLCTAKITAAEVENIFLAGGFGSYINPKEAAEIGLLPKSLAPCAKAVGNSALCGALLLAAKPNLLKTATAFASAAEEIALSTSPVFMQNYIENMAFFEE